MARAFVHTPVGIDAAGHMNAARNSSHSCKFTAIYDWLDNHVSPSVKPKEVRITMHKALRHGSALGKAEVSLLLAV